MLHKGTLCYIRGHCAAYGTLYSLSGHRVTLCCIRGHCVDRVHYVFSDIDECKQNICAQNCDNSAGDFTCSCDSGYSLQDDDVSCVGKSKPASS